MSWPLVWRVSEAISEVNQEISTRRKVGVNWNFSAVPLSTSEKNWVSLLQRRKKYIENEGEFSINRGVPY